MEAGEEVEIIWGLRSAVCFDENTLIIGFINTNKSLFSCLSVIICV